MRQATFKGERKYPNQWEAFDDGYVQGLEIGREAALEAVLKSAENQTRSMLIAWLRTEVERLRGRPPSPGTC